MFPIVLLAQKKEVTLENIWKTYDFYPKSVSGFKSMQDGNYYSKLDKKGDNSQINKYSFRTCLLYTSPSPRDISGSRMPSSA